MLEQPWGPVPLLRWTTGHLTALPPGRIRQHDIYWRSRQMFAPPQVSPGVSRCLQVSWEHGDTAGGCDPEPHSAIVSACQTAPRHSDPSTSASRSQSRRASWGSWSVTPVVRESDKRRRIPRTLKESDWRKKPQTHGDAGRIIKNINVKIDKY